MKSFINNQRQWMRRKANQQRRSVLLMRRRKQGDRRFNVLKEAERRIRMNVHKWRKERDTMLKKLRKNRRGKKKEKNVIPNSRQQTKEIKKKRKSGALVSKKKKKRTKAAILVTTTKQGKPILAKMAEFLRCDLGFSEPESINNLHCANTTNEIISAMTKVLTTDNEIVEPMEIILVFALLRPFSSSSSSVVSAVAANDGTEGNEHNNKQPSDFLFKLPDGSIFVSDILSEFLLKLKRGTSCTILHAASSSSSSPKKITHFPSSFLRFEYRQWPILRENPEKYYANEQINCSGLVVSLPEGEKGLESFIQVMQENECSLTCLQLLESLRKKMNRKKVHLVSNLPLSEKTVFCKNLKVTSFLVSSSCSVAAANRENDC